MLRARLQIGAYCFVGLMLKSLMDSFIIQSTVINGSPVQFLLGNPCYRGLYK